MGVTPDQLPAEIERLKNLLGQINAIAMFASQTVIGKSVAVEALKEAVAALTEKIEDVRRQEAEKKRKEMHS